MKLTEQKINEITELWKCHFTGAEISRITGLSKPVIYGYIRVLKVTNKERYNRRLLSQLSNVQPLPLVENKTPI